METAIYSGGCLCGHIRFIANASAQDPHTCSCEQCQHHSGAMTLSWVTFDKAAVRWSGPGGQPALFRSSDYSSRAFCPQCGSTLGAIDDGPTVGLVLGCFDRPQQLPLYPTAHSFEDNCPSWAKLPGMSDY